MGTPSWAVLNVTTPLSTRGRLSPPWPHSGATRASASYEKSDFCQEPQERKKKSRQKDWQLDFALKEPLKRSHKGTCLFASMQIGILKRMVDLHLWTVKPLTHGQYTTEIEFRCGRPEKRPQRSASPLAWLSSVSPSLPTRLFFQFVLKVQYISIHYTKTLKKGGVDINFSCCYTPYDFGLHRTVNIHVASH